MPTPLACAPPTLPLPLHYYVPDSFTVPRPQLLLLTRLPFWRIADYLFYGFDPVYYPFDFGWRYFTHFLPVPHPDSFYFTNQFVFTYHYHVHCVPVYGLLPRELPPPNRHPCAVRVLRLVRLDCAEHRSPWRFALGSGRTRSGIWLQHCHNSGFT